MDEMVNYDEVMDTEVMTTEGGNAGLSTGAKVAIGVGLVAVGITVGKLIAKAIRKHKEQKALRTPAEGETVEPTEEQVANVTK